MGSGKWSHVQPLIYEADEAGLAKLCINIKYPQAHIMYYII